MEPQIVNSDGTFYLLLIGSVVPVLGYFINKWSWYKNEAPEEFKGLVQLALTTGAGYLFTPLIGDTGGGFINLSEGAFSSVVASLFAHNILWKPAKINVRIGARSTT